MSATTTPPSADSYVNDDDAPALVDSSDDESGGYHSEEIDWSSISSPKTYPTGADIAAYRQRVQDSKSESAPVDLAKRVADLEARQGTTGHVSSPPPEPTKETKGMYARASDWFKSFKTIHHKMDNDDRTLITKTTDAIKGLPREFMAQIGEAMGLPDVESYKSFTALIGLLSDVGLMLLLDTPAQIAVHQAGMLARHGFLTTVLIDALALLVRKILDWLTRPVDQADGPMEEPEKRSWTEAVSALFSVVHYYTIGWIPEIVPRDVIAGLVMANIVGNSARHFEHFGPMIVRFLKACANAIWRLFTGRNFFDADQRQAIDAMVELTAKFDAYFRFKSPSIAQLKTMTADHIAGTLALAVATARDVEKPILDRFESLLRRLSNYITMMTAPSQVASEITPVTTFLMRGAPGEGKSILMNIMISYLAAFHGWPGALGDWVATYSGKMNFEAPLPPNAHFLLLDDVFLNMDDESYAKVMGLIANLGTGKPVPIDAPDVESKGKKYYSGTIDYIGDTENLIHVPQVKVTEIRAIARRFDGGIYDFQLNPRFKDPRGRLNIGLFLKDMKNNAELAFTLTDHEGRVFTPFQAASAIYNRHMFKINNGKIMSAAMQNIAHGVVPGNDTVSPAPTNLDSKAFLAAHVKQAKGKERQKSHIKDQGYKTTLSNDGAERFFHNAAWSAERNKLFVARIVPFLKSADADYELTNDGLTKNGKPILASALHGLFVPPTEATGVNLRVPPSEWKHNHIVALRKKEFKVKGECCGLDGYCYKHGEAMCAVYDPDALKTDYVGLAHWVIEYPSIIDPHANYHAMVAAALTPTMWDYLLPSLYSFLGALAGMGVAMALGAVLQRLFSNLKPVIKDQAYSKFARPANASATVGRKLTVKPLPPSATNQANDTLAKEFLLDKLELAVVPICVSSPTASMESQLFVVAGHVAVANKHTFFTGASHIEIGGRYGVKLPVLHVAKPEQIGKLDVVQYILHPNYDLSFVVLPAHLPAGADLIKFLALDDVDMGSLTGMVQATRRKLTVARDTAGNVLPDLTDRLYPFNLGDVKEFTAYTTIQDHEGIAIKVTTRTLDRACGSPVYTTNTRVGRGCSVIVGIHAAMHDVAMEALCAPITASMVRNFISRVPSGVLAGVVSQAGFLKLQPETDEEREKMQASFPALTYVGRLPVSETQHQSGRNTIQQSSLYNALEGLTIRDPYLKKDVIIGPCEFAPSNCRDTAGMLEKFVRRNHTPAVEDCIRLDNAARETAKTIIASANPDLLVPRDRLFTPHEAVNGFRMANPELDAPGLDMTKSPGYRPGCKPGALGRSYYAEERTSPEGVTEWHLFNWANEVVLDLVAQMTRGEIPNVFVVLHAKPELRQVIDGVVKRPRGTCCYDFLVTVAMRCFTLLVPAVYKSGRGRNRTIFAGDLSAREGEQYLEASKFFDFEDDSDAQKWDASQSTKMASVKEHCNVEIMRLQFPFLDRAALIVPNRLSHTAWLVFGMLVFMIQAGELSGHVLTTPDNCATRETLGRVTWEIAAQLAMEEDPSLVLDYHKDSFSQAYGDDHRLLHSLPQLDNFLASDVAARYGITLVPAADKDGKFTAHTAHESRSMLKRFVWCGLDGLPRAPLALNVLARIPCFVNAKGTNRLLEEHVNADMCLREAFHYDREAFYAIKDRLNYRLALNHAPLLNLDYDVLYAEWFNRLGKSRMTARLPGVAKDQSGVADTKAMAAVTSTLGDTTMIGSTTTAAVTKTDASGNISSQSGISGHSDAAALVEVKPTPNALATLRTPLNPYPPVGVEKILEREYLYAVIDWPTATTVGTRIHEAAMPEAFIALIPNIQEKLSKSQFLRCGIEFRAQVAGNQFAGGAVSMGYVPFYFDSPTDAWRKSFGVCLNGNRAVVSAGGAEAVKLLVPWTSPTTWYDLQASQPTCCCGLFYVDVLAQLAFMSASPPTSIPITIYARLVEVQLAGANPDVVVSSEATAVRRSFEQRRFVPTRRLPGKAKDQSSPAGDARQKAQSNSIVSGDTALQGLASVASAVEGIVRVAGMFDKPNNVALPQPTYSHEFGDSVNTAGVVNTTTWSAPVNAYTTGADKLVPETKPRPSWKDILGIPAVVAYGKIPANVAKADSIWGAFIHPRMALKIISGAQDVYTPGPLAFYTGYHKFYQGGMLIYIMFYAPQSQKATIRITLFPIGQTPVPVTDADSGDATSRVVDIVGDTLVTFPVPYLSIYGQLPTGVIGGSESSALGTLVVQAETAIVSQNTPNTAFISFVVMTAAAPEFSMSGFQDPPASEAVSLTLPSAKFKATRKLDGKAKDQSAPRECEAAAHNATMHALNGNPVVRHTSLTPPSHMTYQGRERVWNARILREVTHMREAREALLNAPYAPVRRLEGRAQNQASARDIFGGTFQPLAPFTPKAHAGIMDPDKTHGPCDLAKRFVLVDDAQSLPYAIQHKSFIAGDQSFWLFCGFTGYSGGRTFRLFQKALLNSSVGYWRVIKVNGLENPFLDAKSFGGALTVDIAQSGGLTFTIPYNMNLPYREWQDSHTLEEDPDSYLVSIFGSSLAEPANAEIWSARADDFQVYMWHAPPYIIYTPPAATTLEEGSESDSDDEFVAVASSSPAPTNGAKKF